MKFVLLVSFLATLAIVPESFAQRAVKASQIGRLAYLSKNTVESDIYDCRFQYTHAFRRYASFDWKVVILSELKTLAKKIHDGDDLIDLYEAEEIGATKVSERMIQVLKELNDGQGYDTDENGIEWFNSTQKMRGRQFLSRLKNISFRNRSFYSVSARFGGADGANEMLAIADDRSGEFIVMGMSSIDNGCF